MKFLLSAVLFLTTCFWSWADVIWSPSRDFFVDPPEGWTFVEDPAPEHFVMTDPSRTVILEIFSQDKAADATLADKTKDLKARLKATGEELTFAWLGRKAWLCDAHFIAGPVKAHGWALVADTGKGWISALAYTPEDNAPKVADVLNSALDSLALGNEGRLEPGPLTAFFQATAKPAPPESKALAGLPTPFTMTYDPNQDEAIQVVLDRESRILTALVPKNLNDQKTIAPAWSRFYRQIYRSFYASVAPLAAYWESQVNEKRVTRDKLPQTVLSWLQSFQYSHKKDLSDISTPWQTLKEGAGDCDSRALVYLALMDQVGVHGILMVSAPYSHGMAALDLPGAGARFTFNGKPWLVAELTTPVALGQIASNMADPSQWIGVDLKGQP